MPKQPKERRYLATCLVCHSQQCETDKKREAESWCTSHMNVYGHGCTVIDRRSE